MKYLNKKIELKPEQKHSINALSQKLAIQNADKGKQAVQKNNPYVMQAQN